MLAQIPGLFTSILLPLLRTSLHLPCVRNSSSDVRLRTNRIRNKQKQRPIDIVDPRDTTLRGILQRAEYAMTAGNDVVADDDDDDNGPASDSD